MRAGRPARQRRLLGVSVALVAICCIAIYPLWNAIYQSPELSELEAAEGRWDARAFTSYALTVVYHGSRGQCRQSVVVSGQRVVQVLDDDCTSHPLRQPLPLLPVSVDGLFDMLRSNLSPNACTDAACQCFTAYRVNPVYDGNLGYPLIVLMVPVGDGDPDTAPGAGQPFGCGHDTPGAYETLSVTQLSPLN